MTTGTHSDVSRRPSVAIVLAAGWSERLREVTGGGSKALVRVGGMALVERAVRTLLASGLDRLVVVTGYHAGPVGAVIGRLGDHRLHALYAEDWELGNGASLAAAAHSLDGAASFRLLVARRPLRRLVEDAEGRRPFACRRSWFGGRLRRLASAVEIGLRNSLPIRPAFVPIRRGERILTRAVRVHGPQVLVAGAIGYEDDFRSIRGPCAAEVL